MERKLTRMKRVECRWFGTKSWDEWLENHKGQENELLVMESWWTLKEFCQLVDLCMGLWGYHAGYTRPNEDEEDDVTNNLWMFRVEEHWYWLRLMFSEDWSREQCVSYVTNYLLARQRQREPAIAMEKCLVMSELVACKSFDFNFIELLYFGKIKDEDVFIYEYVGVGEGVRLELVSDLKLREVLHETDPSKRYFVLASRVRSEGKLLYNSNSYGYCVVEICRLRRRHYGPWASRDWQLECKSPRLKNEVWLQQHPSQAMCWKFPDSVEGERLGKSIWYSRGSEEKQLCKVWRRCW